MRTPAVLLLLALAAALPAPGAAEPPATSQPGLEGLWSAAKLFGPRAQGPLVLRRTGGRWSAEIAGRVVEVRVRDGEFAFSLPQGEGDFRGRLQPDGQMLGLWRQPRTVSDGAMVTPVRLRSAAPDEWVGEVAPLPDQMRFHLLVRRRPDGALGLIVRNPQRDLGAQLGMDRLVTDGREVRVLGGRGAQKDAVLASGRIDAKGEVLSLTLPGRGETYDFVREGPASDFYPRGAPGAAYAYQPPPRLDDGWRTGSLAGAGVDETAISAVVRRLLDAPMDVPGAVQVHALLIARHGKLVLEEYFHGAGREELQTTRSAGKSITSVLIGASLAAGRPIHLSDPVYKVMNGGDFPAGLGARKRRMTLEHLITMSSGFYCDDSDPRAPGAEETMSDQEAEPDYYRYTLAVPMAYEPGEAAVYCSANPNLALGMLGRALGHDPIYDFEALVAAPLQIRRYAWLVDGAGQPFGGGSVQIAARDFLKFGQLMLDGGTWNGRRILSRDYVKAATNGARSIAHIGYGYLWWSTTFPYQGRSLKAFAALGAGGQTLLIVPDLDLVVGIMAGQFASPGAVDLQLNLTPRYILPAVRQPGQRPDASVAPVDYTTPYGRAAAPPPRVTPD